MTIMIFGFLKRFLQSLRQTLETVIIKFWNERDKLFLPSPYTKRQSEGTHAPLRVGTPGLSEPSRGGGADLNVKGVSQG